MRVAPLEMGANNRLSTSTASKPASVELAEADIPGVALDELLDVQRCSFALVAPVSWNQACTFAEKATVDFKVGSFIIIHIKNYY